MHLTGCLLFSTFDIERRMLVEKQLSCPALPKKNLPIHNLSLIFMTCVFRVQSQVDEVIDVMQENISKVIERGERLDDLQDKSGGSQSDKTNDGGSIAFWLCGCAT